MYNKKILSMQRQDDYIKKKKKYYIQKLYIKQKFSFFGGEDRKQTDYNRGLIDGRNISSEGVYYYFTYIYNPMLERVIDDLVKDIEIYYERIYKRPQYTKNLKNSQTIEI